MTQQVLLDIGGKVCMTTFQNIWTCRRSLHNRGFRVGESLRIFGETYQENCVCNDEGYSGFSLQKRAITCCSVEASERMCSCSLCWLHVWTAPCVPSVHNYTYCGVRLPGLSGLSSYSVFCLPLSAICFKFWGFGPSGTCLCTFMAACATMRRSIQTFVNMEIFLFSFLPLSVFPECFIGEPSINFELLRVVVPSHCLLNFLTTFSPYGLLGARYVQYPVFYEVVTRSP